MKIFLKKVVAFILILACIMLLINALYLYQENQLADTMSPMRSGDVELRNVPVGIEIAGFGSSHALLGFDFEDYESQYVCFNFGLPSQFLSYDLRLLQNYLDHFAPGATVLIVVSHFSLFGKPDVEYENFAAMNKRYYKILPDEMIKQYDAKTDFYVNWLPSLASEDIVSLVSTLIGKHQPTNQWESVVEPEIVESQAYARYKTFVESKCAEDGSRLYNQEEIEALYEIIAVCKENDLRPVLITTPYLDAYMDQVRENDPAFLEDFYNLMDQITQNTGVPYFDYSEDTRFTASPELFHDVDHLNRSGARIFMDILIQEVL